MCPYQDLYIYYIKGCPDPECEQSLGSAFIGNWVEDGYSFLFFSEPSQDLVSGLLSRYPDLGLEDSFCIPYNEWQHDQDKVLEIEQFSICAPWVENKPGPGMTRLWLDPGVVFGTGAHPTTSDCVYALAGLYKKARPRQVLDLGTGTGLLAIAAAALGADKVLAVDLNPLAAKTSAKNALLNHMGHKIRAVAGSALDYMNEPADLVVANIHFEVMKSLLQSQGFLDNRYFILSGLLRSEIQKVRDMLKNFRATIFQQWERDNTWFTIMGKTT